MQQQRVTPHAAVVRVFGYFSLIIAAGCFVLFIANMRSRLHYGAIDLSPLGWIAAYAVIGGWGTVRLKRWGAVMLAAPLALAGVVFGVSAVRQQPTLWVLAPV